MEYAIQTDSLVKKYNRQITALNEVSLKIEKGDVVGYVGPNGAGKTTTIKILTNLIRPTSGHAYVNGIDVNRQPKEALRYIGALVEIPGIYSYLTPYELLSYFGKIHRMNGNVLNQQIDEVLELVELSDRAHEKIGTYSTGMQRRLVIAKAILHKPEILMLDEPFLGLDPTGIRDVRELIRQVHARGITVFLSSHLLREVAEICNNIILLDNGKVTASDSMEGIRNKAGGKTINVRFLQPPSQEAIKKIPAIESINSFEILKDTMQIHFDGKPETSSHILSQLVSLDFQVVSFNMESVDIEDFYLSSISDKKKRVMRRRR